MLLQLPNVSTKTSREDEYQKDNESSERFYDTSQLTLIDAKTPSHTRMFASTDTTPVVDNDRIADALFSMSTQLSAPINSSLFPVSDSASTTFHEDIFGQLELPVDLVLPESSAAPPVTPNQAVPVSYATQSAHFLQSDAPPAPSMQELIYQPERFYPGQYNYTPTQAIPPVPQTQSQQYFLHQQQQQQHFQQQQQQQYQQQQQNYHQHAPPPPPTFHFPGQAFPTFDHEALASHSAAAMSAIPIGFSAAPIYNGGTVPPGSYVGTLAATQAIEDRGARRVRGVENRCSVCNVTETPSWRRHKITSAMVCNACGLYYNLHGRDREFVINSRGLKVVKRQPRGVSKKRRQELARARSEANRLRINQMQPVANETGAEAQDLVQHLAQVNNDTMFNVYNNF